MKEDSTGAESPRRRWFTAAEAGEYFSKPAKTLYSLAARDLLPEGSVIRLGRELRFDIGAIERGAKPPKKRGGD